jgi:hypothetical protein
VFRVIEPHHASIQKNENLFENIANRVSIVHTKYWKIIASILKKYPQSSRGEIEKPLKSIENISGLLQRKY